MSLVDEARTARQSVIDKRIKFVDEELKRLRERKEELAAQVAAKQVDRELVELANGKSPAMASLNAGQHISADMKPAESDYAQVESEITQKEGQREQLRRLSSAQRPKPALRGY